MSLEQLEDANSKFIRVGTSAFMFGIGTFLYNLEYLALGTSFQMIALISVFFFIAKTMNEQKTISACKSFLLQSLRRDYGRTNSNH